MPQIVSWKTTPEQAHTAIEQAIVLLDAHDLTADERANLLPVLVGLLADKPIGMTPDAPPIALPNFAGKH